MKRHYHVILSCLVVGILISGPLSSYAQAQPEITQIESFTFDRPCITCASYLDTLHSHYISGNFEHGNQLAERYKYRIRSIFGVDSQIYAQNLAYQFAYFQSTNDLISASDIYAEIVEIAEIQVIAQKIEPPARELFLTNVEIFELKF